MTSKLIIAVAAAVIGAATTYVLCNADTKKALIELCKKKHACTCAECCAEDEE